MEKECRKSENYACPYCGAKLKAISNEPAVRCEKCGAAVLIDDFSEPAVSNRVPGNRSKQKERTQKQQETGSVWTLMLACSGLLVLLIAILVLLIVRSRKDMVAAENVPEPSPTIEIEEGDYFQDEYDFDDIGDDAIDPASFETNDNSGEEESIGSKVVDIALTRLGCPYVYGKKGSEKFDCSGLVYWAIHEENPELGERLYTNAAGQAKYCYDHGLIVERSDLQPGDLVFWVYKKCKGCHRWREIHHVAIYVGEGKVVEAAGDKGRVVIRKLWETKECPIIFYGRPY